MGNPPRGLHLYIAQSNVTGAVKIGRSSKPESRLRSLQTGNPHKLRLLAVFKEKGKLELTIQRSVQKFRLRVVEGEWFHYDCLSELPPWIYDELPFEDRWFLPEGLR